MMPREKLYAIEIRIKAASPEAHRLAQPIIVEIQDLQDENERLTAENSRLKGRLDSVLAEMAREALAKQAEIDELKAQLKIHPIRK